MRLRLNTTLRAALIAAITAVGFTVTQTEAADTTLANIMNQGGDPSVAVTTTIWGNTGVLDTVTASYEVTAGAQTPTSTAYTNSILATRTNVGSNSKKGTYTYTLNFTTADISQNPVTLSAINVDFVTFNGAGQGHNQDNGNKINCAWTLTDVTGNTLVVDLPANGKATSTAAVYTKSEDGSYTTGGFTGGTARIAFDDLALQSNKTYTLTLTVNKNDGADGFFVGIGNIALINTVTDPTSTWIGGEGHTTWSDSEAWNGDVPTEGIVAAFDASGTGTTVTIGSAAQALSVTVSDKEYTFNLSEGGSLTTGTLTITDGASLALAGAGTVEVGGAVTVTGTNALTIGEKATLKLTNGDAAKALMKNSSVTNNGTLELGADVTIGTAADSSTMTGTLLVKEHKLTIGADDKQTASISSFSSVKLEGGTLYFNNKQDVLHNLVVEASKTGVIDSYDMGKDSDGAALVLDGTTNIYGTLTIQNQWNAQFNIKQLAGAGTLNIKGKNGGSSSDEGATYTINSEGFTGKVDIANSNATVKLADGAKLGTMEIGPGSLLVDTDSTATVASLKVRDNKAATITVNGTLNVEGLFNTWSCGNATTVTGSDAGVMKVGSMDLSNVGTNMALSHITLTVTGDATAGNSDRGKNNTRIDMSDGAKLNLLGNVSFNTDNNKFCTLNVNGGTITAGEATETQATRTFQNIVAGAQGGTVTFLNGTNSVANLDMTAGDLAVTVGANASLSVANAVLRSTITGDVTFTGTIDITNHDVTDRTDVYTGGETEGNVNGFRATTGTMRMATGTVTDTGATYMLGTTDVTQQVDKGVYTFSGETDYTTFYVNEASEKVTTAQSGQEPLESIVVAADGTLDVDQDIDLSLIDSTSTGKINIDQNKTVTAGNATTGTKLAGEGNIVLKSGATNLAGATMTKDWAGTAKVSGTIINIDLNNYGQEGSKVEMNGVSGYFLQAANKEFTPELVLNGSGLTLTDGFSTLADKKTPTGFIFNGGVSGSGSMTFNKATGSVTQRLYFTGDVSDWTGSLNVVSGFTVYAQYTGTSQTVNSTITKSNGTLNVEVGTGSDSSAVTFNENITANSLTVQAGATANIEGDLTAPTITVAAGATMNMAGGTLSNAITNSGTVALSGTVLNANGFSEASGGTAYVALNGDVVTEEANHYVGSQTYVQVVNNAENATSTGTAMWKGTSHELNANGRIITGASEVDYTTFYVTTGESLGNIKASEHGGALAAVNVSGGALVVNQDAAGIAIKVTEEGTITGEYADASKVGIDSMATASYTGTVAEGGISITPGEGKTVSVTNYGEDVSGYTAGNGQLMVSAENGTLTMTKNDGDVVVNNYVAELGNLVNTTGNALTLSGQDVLELNNMNITGSTVGLTYVDLEQKTLEGTVSIVGVLEGGKGTLLADLTFKNGSTLDVDGGAGNALTLGSTLTFDFSNGNGALVNLDDATIAALGQLQDGQSLDLIVAANGTQLDYVGAQTGMDYAQLFAPAEGLTGNYTVYAKDDAFGLTKQGAVPEPTTGTLSLLALMALAARRRRK